MLTQTIAKFAQPTEVDDALQSRIGCRTRETRCKLSVTLCVGSTAGLHRVNQVVRDVETAQFARQCGIVG